MARNEEKHSGRLNRLWLQRLDEEYAKKNPTRPGLGSLRTAQDVKKWMPSIKKDIDFFLKQSQVGCYPDRKIAEFSEKIDSLTKEYKAYLRKYRELEGCHSSTPWVDEPYHRKHKSKEQDVNSDVDIRDTHPLKKVRRGSDVPACSGTPCLQISLPILDREETYKDIYGYSIFNPKEPALSDIDGELNDHPLEFNWNKNQKALEYKGQSDGDSSRPVMGNEPLVFEWTKSNKRCDCKSSDYVICDPKMSMNSKCDPKMSMNSKCCSCCETQMDKLPANNSKKESNVKVEINVRRKQCECDQNQTTLNKVNRSCDKVAPEKLKEVNSNAGNILNLPYSDSSSDEDSLNDLT